MPTMSVTEKPYWERKSLAELTDEEWESLCDGCGKCCLRKLEDADTGEIHYTDVACRLLDTKRCRCRRYADRRELVADCATLTPSTVTAFGWLPSTCAYRLLAEGKPLEWWHPLVSGDPDTVHRAGVSIKGRTTSEAHVHDDELEGRIVDWPK
jgi:uncharacterized protein